jgi:hypothetical protein
MKTCGVIAQLGERLHGMQEVVGSIPSGSTTLSKNSLKTCLAHQPQKGNGGGPVRLNTGPVAEYMRGSPNKPRDQQ